MRVFIFFGILLALAFIGATYTGGPGDIPADTPDDTPTPPQNKSEIIFNAIKNKGINVENAYTSKGSEIKEAFSLDNSNIEDNSLIAFVIFRYPQEEGVDRKVELTFDVIYTSLSVEPSIDGILAMPYDPSLLSLGVSPNLIYTNRSHAYKVALQNISMRKAYNEFEIYTLVSEINES